MALAVVTLLLPSPPPTSFYRWLCCARGLKICRPRQNRPPHHAELRTFCTLSTGASRYGVAAGLQRDHLDIKPGVWARARGTLNNKLHPPAVESLLAGLSLHLVSRSSALDANNAEEASGNHVAPAGKAIAMLVRCRAIQPSIVKKWYSLPLGICNKTVSRCFCTSRAVLALAPSVEDVGGLLW